MKAPILIIFYCFLLFILSFGCKKDTNYNCPANEYIKFSHLDSTRSPYTGKETLRFLYRNGKTIDTFIFKPKQVLNDTVSLGETRSNDYCVQQHYGQRHKFVYTNTKKTNPQYDLTILYTSRGGDAEFDLTYDSIIVHDNLFGLDNPDLGHYHSSKVFEGQTFYIVNDFEYRANPMSKQYYTVYYTSHDGIIRMEYASGASLTLLL